MKPGHEISQQVYVCLYEHKSVSVFSSHTSRTVDKQLCRLIIPYWNENRLIGTFPDALFSVDNYHMQRADRNSSVGVVMAYLQLRSDVIGTHRPDLEAEDIKSIGVEIAITTTKVFLGVVLNHQPLKMTIL